MMAERPSVGTRDAVWPMDRAFVVDSDTRDADIADQGMAVVVATEKWMGVEVKAEMVAALFVVSPAALLANG